MAKKNHGEDWIREAVGIDEGDPEYYDEAIALLSQKDLREMSRGKERKSDRRDDD